MRESLLHVLLSDEKFQMPLASLKTPIALYAFFMGAAILLHIGVGFKRRWHPVWLTLISTLLFCTITFVALRNELEMFPDYAIHKESLFSRTIPYATIRRVDLGHENGKLVLKITSDKSTPVDVNCQTFAWVPSQFPAALRVLYQRTPQAQWNEMALRWKNGDVTE